MDYSAEAVSLHIDTPPIEPFKHGGGGWHLQGPEHESHAWFDGAFNDAELDAIIRIGESLYTDQAKVAGEVVNHKVRDSETSWLFPNEMTGWIFDRVASAIMRTNADWFRFELVGLMQGLQFTKYIAPGQHYDWHQDRGPNCGIRKLSMSLQLSDPADYEGGDLQFKFGKGKETFQRKRGMMAIFPSWTLHRVTPVTSGVRHSLVAWISGPPFK